MSVFVLWGWGCKPHVLMPNLEDRSTSLASLSKDVQHGWPYQQLGSCCNRFLFTDAHRPCHLAEMCLQEGGGPLRALYSLMVVKSGKS